MSWSWSDWDNMSSYWVLNIVHSLPESPLQWTNFHATKRSFWWNLARFRFKTHLTSCKNCCNESHADKLSWSEITLSSKEKKITRSIVVFCIVEISRLKPIHPSIHLLTGSQFTGSLHVYQTETNNCSHSYSHLQSADSPPLTQNAGVVLNWAVETHLQILKGPTVNSYVAFFSRDTSSPQWWYSDKAVDKICLRV